MTDSGDGDRKEAIAHSQDDQVPEQDNPAPSGENSGDGQTDQEAANASSDSSDEQRRIWAKPSQLLVIAVVLVLGILLILWAWRIWPFTTSVVQTDDSYVHGNVTMLSPQVSGYVTKIEFTDFERVEAGEILFMIDDRLYQAAVDEAQAQVEEAKATLANAQQSIAQDQAMIVQKLADIKAADAARGRDVTESRRVDGLASRGSVSEREREQADAAAKASAANVSKAQAALAVAREQLKSTRVSKIGLQANVDRAQAALETAQVNLENTVIRAPVSGQVSEASVRPGQFVMAGSLLVYLVPKQIWVVANFKESDTRDMRIGQPATLSVDALGGESLRGRVERLAPATGTEFSVLKPDNATGNFTKVVRRVPVRIAIEPNQVLAARLRPGLSVVTKVDTAAPVIYRKTRKYIR